MSKQLLGWLALMMVVMGAIGMVGATLITLTANSSTPLLAYAAGILGVCLWPMRRNMRIIRLGIVGALLGLSAVMKAPVWFVIAHIDLTGSSSSYHRAELIDAFVKHFRDWWLIGVKDSGSWGWDLWDAQNQFVSTGQTGGLLSLILFIGVIVVGFKRVGHMRKLVELDLRKQWMLWLLGTALFANVVAFFGVNYFDQSKNAWFALLAIISVMTVPPPRESEGPELPASGSTQLDGEYALSTADSSEWWGGKRAESKDSWWQGVHKED